MPLRPLGVGDFVEGAWRAVLRNPKVMFGASAVVAIVNSVLIVIAQLVLLRHINVSFDDAATDSRVDVSGFVALEVGAVAIVFITVITGALLAGFVTLAVADDVIGRRPMWAELWTATRPRMWALVGVILATTLLQTLGFIACIAPGVWLWGIWAVAVPALMTERARVGQAMRRSRHLVAGTFWRVWGIRALGFLMVGAGASIVALPFTVIGMAVSGADFFNFGTSAFHLPTAYIVLSGIGNAVGQALTAPFLAAWSVLQYVDLRIRKENLLPWLYQRAGLG